MTNNKLPLVILAVAVLGLAGCNREGERAQDNFNAAGHSMGNAATDTGHALSDGAHATGQAIGTGARHTGDAIDNTVNGHYAERIEAACRAAFSPPTPVLFPLGRLLAARALAFFAGREESGGLLRGGAVEVIAAFETPPVDRHRQLEFLRTHFADLDGRFRGTGHDYSSDCRRENSARSVIRMPQRPVIGRPKLFYEDTPRVPEAGTGA